MKSDFLHISEAVYLLESLYIRDTLDALRVFIVEAVEYIFPVERRKMRISDCSSVLHVDILYGTSFR